MQVIIEVSNEHALNLLQELAQLKLIKFIDKEENPPEILSKKSRFAGRISAKTASDLHQQLNEMREEWQR